jgi:predicted Zn-dependent protease with MMP-like domain
MSQRVEPGRPQPDPSDPFEAALAEAIDGLPSPFREQLDTVAVVIEDWPTTDQLASVHAWGLYGLYQGVPRTAYGADGAAWPSRITLFRGPLVRANPTPDGLRDAVAETLRHELGHHLGLSDARMRELEQGAS